MLKAVKLKNIYILSILHKLLQKVDEETLPNWFYQSIITLIAKPVKDTIRKVCIIIPHEHVPKNP